MVAPSSGSVVASEVSVSTRRITHKFRSCLKVQQNVIHNCASIFFCKNARSRLLMCYVHVTLYILFTKRYTHIQRFHYNIPSLMVLPLTGSVVSSEVCLSTRAYKLTSYLKGVI